MLPKPKVLTINDYDLFCPSSNYYYLPELLPAEQQGLILVQRHVTGCGAAISTSPDERRFATVLFASVAVDISFAPPATGQLQQQFCVDPHTPSLRGERERGRKKKGGRMELRSVWPGRLTGLRRPDMVGRRAGLTRFLASCGCILFFFSFFLSIGVIRKLNEIPKEAKPQQNVQMASDCGAWTLFYLSKPRSSPHRGTTFFVVCLFCHCTVQHVQ